MFSLTKKNIKIIVFWLLILMGCLFSITNQTQATYVPKFADFVSGLKGWVTESKWVSSENLLRQNVVALFYPSSWGGGNSIYNVIKGMTLWVMIVYFIRAWASILFSRKPEDMKKTLRSLVYILIWWLFVYGANRIFWNVLHFNEDAFTQDADWMKWISAATHGVFFVVLSAIKAFAFFLAIIMIVITWFKVIAAWEWEKWKKLVKWLINVVIWLLIIKWIDFIYYLAADTWTFVKNAVDLIIKIAKIFAYIYGTIIFIMVIVAWYLYMTDGWGGSNFKKASNILINILLSALVLFSFLLILYQIFAEFQEGWDAVTMILKNIA